MYNFRREHVTFSSGTTYLLDAGKYDLLKYGFTFPESLSYLAIGATKTTHIVEGTGKASAAIVVGGWFSSIHQVRNYSYKCI
jgi:hypothetical protein